MAVSKTKKKSSKKLSRPAWRKAIRQVMYRAAQRESEKWAGHKKPSFNYRWEHVSAVASVAQKLAGIVGADEEIVEAAAWLHDIAKLDGKSHGRAGSKFALLFLPKTDFPPEKIESVALAIDQHVGLWRRKPLTNIEAMVLWDADKLTKLGLTAAFHFTGMFMNGDKTITTAQLIERGLDADWQIRVVNSLHTKPARQAAKVRLKRYRKLWKRLEREIGGEDL